MLNKMPWFDSRKRFIFAALSDVIIFFSFLYRYSVENFIFNKNISEILIFLITWIVLSYVLGRYAVTDRRLSSLILRQILSTFVLVLLLIILCLSYYSIMPYDYNNLYLESIDKIILVATTISILIQSSINIVLNKFNFKRQKWILIGSHEREKIFMKELRFKRINAIVKSIDDKFDLDLSKDISGFIIDDLNSISKTTFEKIITIKSQGFEIINIFDWCEKILQRYPTELISKENFLSIDFSSTKNIFRFRLKRSGEFILSLILIILLSPLLIIASLFILLEDNGPILYSQYRTGIKGRKFKIYKLRTMKVDAEKKGPQWASKEDQRITKIGKILRKTRIDELPQLLCVLSGEMSLIGPRPERPEIEEELIRQIPNYHLRFLIKPGLSGWAQVNYPYGASIEDTRKKLSYDLYYLKNFSILLDFLILFKTLRLVLNARGSKPIN